MKEPLPEIESMLTYYDSIGGREAIRQDKRDAKINIAKEQCKVLSQQQEEIFQKLSKNIGLTERGEYVLSDFIYNDSMHATFSGYVKKYKFSNVFLVKEDG